MSYKESTIIAGNTTLKGYEENGIYRQASGLESFYRFIYTPQIPAGDNVLFRFPDNLQLVSFWAETESTVQSTSAISINVLDPLNNFAGTFTIDANIIQLGNIFSWIIPFMALETGFSITIGSNNLILRNTTVFAKSVHLLPIIVGIPTP